MHINIYFLSALASVVVLAWEAMRTFQRRQTHNIEDIVIQAVQAAVGPLDARLDSIDKRLVIVETKMDLVIGGVAIGAATVLHHPDATRARIDYLLDEFRDGRITPEESEELKGYLRTIINWDGTQPSPPFTLYPGEQTAAAVLLATMDHVNDTGELDLNGLLDPPACGTEEAGA